MLDIVIGGGRAPPTLHQPGLIFPSGRKYTRKWPLPRVFTVTIATLNEALLWKVVVLGMKKSYQFRLTTSRNPSSSDNGFRLLVSSNPLLRFPLVVSRDLANLGKTSSGI